MIPKDAVRYVIKSVLLRLTDLEAENKLLKAGIERLKNEMCCVDCGSYIGYDDKLARGICDVCCLPICCDCDYKTTDQGLMCNNHCSVCCEDFTEENSTKNNDFICDNCL